MLRNGRKSGSVIYQNDPSKKPSKNEQRLPIVISDIYDRLKNKKNSLLNKYYMPCSLNIFGFFFVKKDMTKMSALLCTDTTSLPLYLRYILHM